MRRITGDRLDVNSEWRQSKPNPKRPRSTGITPTLFYKVRNGTQPNELKKTLLQAKTREKLKQLKYRVETFKEHTVYEEFPIQEPALQRLDELEKDYLEKSNDDRDQRDEEYLWSMKPKVFALELSSTGKRKYIVSQSGRFFQHYWMETDASLRHYYELIRDGDPCRLFFDLEYNRDANPDIDDNTSEVLLDEFLSELYAEVQDKFQIVINRANIIDLCSSTEKKFSRHIIVHFPNGELFSSAKSCGMFVKRFVGNLVDNFDLHRTKPTLSKYLLVKSKPSNDDDPKNKTCFVDMGVYTKNRLFRLMGSSKYGKQPSAALRISSHNEFPFPTGFNNNLFYLPDILKLVEHRKGCSDDNLSLVSIDIEKQISWENHAKALSDTLVVPITTKRYATIFELEQRDEFNPDKQSPSKLGIRPWKPLIVSSNNEGPSPFPIIDNFISKAVVNWKGIPGHIRGWSINHQPNNVSKGEIVYQVKDNRWCENIMREHKSNNVMWHVNLSDCTYWQTCWDPGKCMDLHIYLKQSFALSI